MVFLLISPNRNVRNILTILFHTQMVIILEVGISRRQKSLKTLLPCILNFAGDQNVPYDDYKKHF